MQTSAIVTLLFGFMAQSALATVNLGTDSAGTPIAWISGQSECTHTVTNGCDNRFTLSNGVTYYIKGCGGAGLTLFNNDNSFNANCRSVGSQHLACGVTENWSC
ncbi:hypothetical protein N5P37_008790 [Trichoderma harzianum]|uniref:Cyanovirin-N domain-containing protein n=1 Tax=Trichoderma harzianum CBS 226.95 TaxID=983964 RepID=A0A2T4A723_TRIHA|nr:hypothetical protein M431DRAFT_89933 [Trichoderma harzianum CBS 226.95]KAK0758392.1 hypothetical protein N5P37_008790 [Trichoderma harzianum]PKK41611.1 hypothetical protein CI102_14447 [Trichoderma harzianum]PTB52860.1 hypothetical protein M431DRAFT_89933 [Trichoderma harzianum CBS 226.95]